MLSRMYTVLPNGDLVLIEQYLGLFFSSYAIAVLGAYFPQYLLTMLLALADYLTGDDFNVTDRPLLINT